MNCLGDIPASRRFLSYHNLQYSLRSITQSFSLPVTVHVHGFKTSRAESLFIDAIHVTSLAGSENFSPIERRLEIMGCFFLRAVPVHLPEMGKILEDEIQLPSE